MSLINLKKNKAPESDLQQKEASLPPSGQVFTIDILEIEPCRLNPRHTKGKDYQKKYESLKESIRNVGLQSTLQVTKWPECEQYELYNGGNTRRQILIELYHEFTENGELEKAQSIRYQQVIFTHYTDDLDILVKHMAENEERISMTFIDKARAVFKIKDIYLKQHSEEDISHRKLSGIISELGWSGVKQQAMTELSFAFEKLDDVIPLALNNGMGKSKIQQLRLWLSYTDKYVSWLLDNNDFAYSVAQAETLYFDVLRKCDDDIEPIDLDAFYQDFLYELSTELMAFDPKLKYDTVRFEFTNIEELGYVPEEKPIEELREALEETQDVPRFEYPEGRKPRQPKAGSEPEASSEPDVSLPQTETDISQSVPESAIEIPETVTAPKTSISVPTDISNEALQAQCFEKASKVLAELVDKFDSTHTLRELIAFWDAEDTMQSIPPFFSLDLSCEQKRVKMATIINSAETPEQFLALHLLYVYVVYHRNDIDISKLDEVGMATYNNLLQIWHHSSLKYIDFLGICQTGLVLSDMQHKHLLTVHQLTQEHLAICNLVETNYYNSIAGDGGE